MKIKNLIDEDFIQYKKPSMFIGMPYCSFKCDREAGCVVCQNSDLAAAPSIEIEEKEIVERYFTNPISEAIIFGGLEPFDTGMMAYHHLLLVFKREKRKNSYEKKLPTFVFYTGYYPSEVEDKIEYLKENFSSVSIIVKFGRFIPGRLCRYDKMLGVMLASNNQFAISLNDEDIATMKQIEYFYKNYPTEVIKFLEEDANESE